MIMINEVFMNGLCGVILALLLAFTTTPAVRAFAYILGAIDVPKDNRRMHTKPIPRIGGLAIFVSFVVSTAIFCEHTDSLLAIYAGGLLIVIVGVIDDIKPINAWFKLLAQIAAALIAVGFGVKLNFVNLFGEYFNFGIWSIPLTVLWIVGLTNAINLIDGLDGLACGVSAISSVSLFFITLIKGDTQSAIIIAILASSCIGFLPFNSNPAKIFMGDTGALFLGYTLAVFSIEGVFKMHTVLSFLIPIAVFALPLFDTVNAFTRRLLKHKSPFSPDKNHLHHKLIERGFSQKQSVYIIYAICAILGLASVTYTGANPGKALIILGVGFAVLGCYLFLISKYGFSSKKGFGIESETLEMLSCENENKNISDKNGEV